MITYPRSVFTRDRRLDSSDANTNICLDVHDTHGHRLEEACAQRGTSGHCQACQCQCQACQCQCECQCECQAWIRCI
jgi:hypothetical protein